MAKQREEVLNAALGSLLIDRHPLWNEANVHIDSTQTIRGRPELKIDVLVENPGGQPVAIETKFEGSKVGKELQDQIEERMGLTIHGTGDTIESGISVVWTKGLTGSGVANAELKYSVHQLGERDEVQRWPENNDEWVSGSVDDLADAVEIVSLSETKIRRGGEILSNGVRDASARLQQSIGELQGLGETLHQQDGEQTIRMAAAIIVNAFVFHFAIEGQDDIPPVADGSGEGGKFLKSQVIRAWEAILTVNYWPIFSIAKSLLTTIPTRASNPLLDKAHSVAEELLDVGAATFHDLAARMFQTLIADRKFLATFYTLPESACLLAELAVSRLHVDWGREDEVEGLKVADFACGTGTLLSAVQRAMYRRLRRASIDDGELHGTFMERVLLGTDIMPSAAHLAASMLSSAHPRIGYAHSLIRVLPYGVDKDVSKRRRAKSSTAYIGALDLGVTELGHNLFTQSGVGHEVEIGGTQMTGTGGRQLDDGRSFPVEHESFDLVIMNPPFTRPTNHESSTVPIPSFAGFDTSKKEQAAMSKKLKSQDKRFGNGNAGLASNFMDLAHGKLKPGGVLGLVLPFSFLSGKAWERARESLFKSYGDVHIVAISRSGNTKRAFSADTGMAECLVVATKRGRQTVTDKVTYVNLPRRPSMLIEGHEFGRGSGVSTIVGTSSDTGAAGLADSDIADVIFAMVRGKLSLPRQTESFRLPVAPFSTLATRGVVHRDINGQPPRGPFDIQPLKDTGIATYPVLWSHKAERERQFQILPDSKGVVRDGMLGQANETWKATASRLHHNLDFQLNSQSLALCITPEPSIGGRAWPNIKPLDPSYTYPLLLWGNSTLGLMLFWWKGSRQHQGRSILTISRIPNLPTLDASALSDRQLNQFRETFEEFKSLDFLPANEAYRDETRKRLDAALFRILGIAESALESLELLRMKWCCEPSVHGGKSTKPKKAV